MALITQLAYTRDPPVHVRVGSERFVTSLGTLCQQPGSLLAALFTDPFPLQDSFTGEHVLPLDIVTGAAFALILDRLRSGEWLPIQHQDTLGEIKAGCQNLGLRLLLPTAAAGETGRGFLEAPGEVEVSEITAERPPHSGTFQLHYAVADLGRRGHRVCAQISGEVQLHDSGMSKAHNSALAAEEARKHFETSHRSLPREPAIVLQRVGRRHHALEQVLKAPVERDDGAWLRGLLAL